MGHPTNRQARRAVRAIKSAQHRGVNPRNSWTTASAIFEANERRDMQRDAEREARDNALFEQWLLKQQREAIEADSANGDFVPAFLREEDL